MGVSMAHFNDNFLTILRMAMAMGKQAECMKDVKLQFEDAKGEAANSASWGCRFCEQTGRRS